MPGHKLLLSHKGRLFFLAIFVLFLVISVSLLIFTTYQSHKKLQASYVRLWKEQMSRRTEMLDAFLTSRQRDVQRLASSPQVVGYYQAKDLGMTMRYGLRASLSQARELFQETLEKSRIEGGRIFSRFVLTDSRDRVLVDTAREALPAYASQAPDVGSLPWSALKGASPRLEFLEGPDGEQNLAVRTGVFFKRAQQGQVIGWVSAQLIQELFCRSSGTSRLEFISMALNQRYLRALSCHVPENLPSIEMIDPGTAERFESLNLSIQQGTDAGPDLVRTGPMVALRLDLAHVPASMIWFKPLDEVFGKAAPGQLLVIMGVFLVVIAAGGTYFVWSMARHAALQQHLQQAQKMEAVGNLAGGIAHDFNNLLQGLSSIVELMQLRLSHDHKNATYLQRMDEIISKAAQLVRGLLTFSRKHEPQLQPVNLNDQVHKTVAILERTIPKMIELRLELEPELKTIDADPVHIQQVIINLVNNAKDAIPAERSGSMVISTANVSLGKFEHQIRTNLQSRECVQLSVSDNGSGMDQETSQRLFEPFYSTKGVGKGTGLGLSMVYGIVREHGADIECTTQPGQGTVFRIFFPVSRLVHTEIARPEMSSQDGQPDLLHVLVVDDEPMIAESLKDYLSGQGHTVDQALSGEEALHKVQSRAEGGFDAVILDLGMPGMGGEMCLKRLLEIDPGLKIIVGSGYGHHELAADPSRYGVQAFLPKPYTFQAIADQLRRVAHRA